MHTQSSLYRELTGEELDRICMAHLGPGEMEPPRLLEGGYFNTTYLLTQKEPARRLVLRAGPVNTHLLLPFEHRLMQSEQEVYRLFHEHGIPTSHVVACDTSRRLLDRDYMLVDFIESVPLSDPSIADGEREPLYEETGRYAARIHNIPGEGFGRVADVAAGNGCSSWLDWLLGELRELETACLEHKVLSPETLRRLRAVFEERSALFEGIKQPKLVHADLWEGNILVSRGGQGSRVAAIIDADRALFGDPDFDLSCPWITHEAYFRGMGTGRLPVDGPRREKMDAYQLLVAAIDCYVWLIEYNNPEYHKTNQQKVLELTRLLLDGRAGASR